MHPGAYDATNSSASAPENGSYNKGASERKC